MANRLTNLEKVSAREHLRRAAGFYFVTHSPGDGVIRFISTPGNSYFGPASGDFTALGRKEAEAYAAGRIHGAARTAVVAAAATAVAAEA